MRSGEPLHLKTATISGLRQILLLLATILVSQSVLAQIYASDVTPGSYQQGQNISQDFQYLEDLTASLDFQKIYSLKDSPGWQAPIGDTFNFGFTSTVYWLKGTLHNPTEQRVKRYLELVNPLLDNVEIYLIRDGRFKKLQLGDHYPFYQRPLRHPNLVLPVSLPAESEAQLFIRLQTTSSMQVSLNLMDSEELRVQQIDQTLVIGIYYGVMLVMMIYNLFMYLIMRERNYLYYVLYVGSVGMFTASLNGMAYQYLWPNLPQINQLAPPFWLVSCTIFIALFSIQFLFLFRAAKPLAVAFITLCVAAEAMFVATTFVPLHYLITPAAVLGVAAVGCAIAGGILQWRRGHPAAKYYTLAWGCTGLAALALASNQTAIFELSYNHSLMAFYLGTALEVIILSFALAQRINDERFQRLQAEEIAQDAYLKATEAKIRIYKMQQTAQEITEQKVLERTQELEAAARKLQQISTIDGLTGIKNRRYFDIAYQKAYERAFRDQEPLTVILVDVDHFKQFNDTYGHQAGDEVLKLVAKAIQSAVHRSPDAVARYGGEEFCVLLPSTDSHGATTVAESIRVAIENVEFQVEGQRVPITASVGAASATPVDLQHPKRLIERADQALYRSKENGRNRITVDHQAVA